MVTIDSDERARLKAAREAKGWKQAELADHIDVTPATISNIETGRHPQVRKVVYADLLRALFRTTSDDAATDADATFRALVEDLVDLDVDQQEAIRAIVKTVKKPR